MTNGSEQYELKSVRALRGREGSAKAAWHNRGWEFVSESRGTLRTELHFRRAKPKAFGAHARDVVLWLRRWQSKTRLVVVGTGALALAAVAIGVGIGTQRGNDLAPSLEDGPAAQSAVQPAVASAPAERSSITDVTIEELVDKLNQGGVALGSLFRVRAELTGSEYWSTGASGDFFVMLETGKGSDLQVNISDESDAAGWRDGEEVEMVVKVVEVTIDGEVLDGFLEAQSTTISDGKGR